MRSVTQKVSRLTSENDPIKSLNNDKLQFSYSTIKASKKFKLAIRRNIGFSLLSLETILQDKLARFLVNQLSLC